jgi:hypothetical protein
VIAVCSNGSMSIRSNLSCQLLNALHASFGCRKEGDTTPPRLSFCTRHHDVTVSSVAYQITCLFAFPSNLCTDRSSDFVMRFTEVVDKTDRWMQYHVINCKSSFLKISVV